MQSRQSGGIVTFAIVAVVLAGLLAGGLYMSKQQGRVATNGGPTQSQPAPNDQTARPETAKQNNGAPAAPAKPSEPEQSKPAPSTQPPQTSSTSTSQPVASTGPTEVPSTGPTETALVSGVFGVLAFAGYRLAVSRRGLRRSALSR